MLSGGRLGSTLAGLGAGFAVLGVAARSVSAMLAAMLLAGAGFLLAGAAWSILAQPTERPSVRAAGWAVVVGFLFLASYGLGASAGAPSVEPLFVAAFLLVVVGECAAVVAFLRERGAGVEAAWLATSAVGALVAAVATDVLVSRVALGVFFVAWAGLGFAVVRPSRPVPVAP